ncbi:nucleotidyltransferase family protein [Janibacter limosus]|uniref:nucleotidyltransferase family protein n=1 Tax=Janibacter limosus TaxID=53458 RepID=UPI0013EE8A21|nr:nucleotidyltransferase family protein [Janibacter limosus]
MSEPLTLAEAVPLGTVHLQRLLSAAGIRSLVIKGPAFVELGVRRPRQSNDIDLMVAAGDRAVATETLASAGWSIISHWFPPALDDIIYSTTFRHERFPATLDLHHHFSGMLADDAFEHLWSRRVEVVLAGQPVHTVGVPDALIIEALNAIKALARDRRKAAVSRVVESAVPVDVSEVARASETIGSRHTATLLIEGLGGPSATGPVPAGYRRWLRRGARNGGLELVLDILLRAPHQAPRVIWQQLTLSPDIARFWADTHRVPYHSPRQVLWVRIRRALRR